MLNDDYILRSDIQKAIGDWFLNDGDKRSMMQVFEDIPAADVVSVVRCRDCKFASMTYDGECKYCACFASKDEYGELDPELYLPGDFFCAFGERKEDSDAEVR